MTQKRVNPPQEARSERTERKWPYRKPVLTCFGDIRTKTLSPTVVLEIESGKLGNYSDRV